MILGLSVDNTLKAAADFAKANDFAWPQCYLGQWSETVVPAAFGVEGLPHAILISAEGVVAAAREVHLKVPLVVRLEGTNVELGKKILAESGLPIISGNDMADAAQKVVAAAKS